MPKEWNLNNSDTFKNRYTIKSLIAQGGIGNTYLAIDSTSKKDVVLKALNFAELKNWKELELFKREVQVLKSIDYPLIPDYYDYFETAYYKQKLFILVQEYVNGENLYQQVKQGKRFSSAEVERIMQTLLTTLDYIHNLKPPIVHRDITPKNIILDDQNRIYLVDFGAVGHIVDNTMAASKSDTFVGTIGYMPPEQLYGKATAASDLYSLGVTVLFLLSGKEPSQFKLKDLRLDYSLHVDMPYSMARLIDKMVEPNMDRRIQSAKEALKIIKKTSAAKNKERERAGGAREVKKLPRLDLKNGDINKWAGLKLEEQKRIARTKQQKKQEKQRRKREKELAREQRLTALSDKSPRRVFMAEEKDKGILRIEKISFWRTLWSIFRYGTFTSLIFTVLIGSFAVPFFLTMKEELFGTPVDVFLDPVFSLAAVYGLIMLFYMLSKLNKSKTFHILITDKDMLLMYFKNPQKPFFVGYKNDLQIGIENQGYGPARLPDRSKAWKTVAFKTPKREWQEHAFNEADADRIRVFIRQHKLKQLS
ncbi:MAG: serine/threonine protein kinase [Spirochaetales bacterium]|nr:serine/threonine protein kinase [Spirochaetales bacterium]